MATKHAAYAVMRSRIRVNALAIGWMDTPGEDEVQKTVHGAGDDWLSTAEAQQPFGRLLKVDEVAFVGVGVLVALAITFFFH